MRRMKIPKADFKIGDDADAEPWYETYHKSM
jgi:hypothetical protein